MARMDSDLEMQELVSFRTRLVFAQTELTIAGVTNYLACCPALSLRDMAYNLRRRGRSDLHGSIQLAYRSAHQQSSFHIERGRI